MRLLLLDILFDAREERTVVGDREFWPLCFDCGAPVNPRVGWVRYDDGRVYHRNCDEKALCERALQLPEII